MECRPLALVRDEVLVVNGSTKKRRVVPGDRAAEVLVHVEDDFRHRIAKLLPEPTRGELAEAVRDYATSVMTIDLPRALVLSDLADAIGSPPSSRIS